MIIELDAGSVYFIEKDGALSGPFITDKTQDVELWVLEDRPGYFSVVESKNGVTMFLPIKEDQEN